MKHDKQPQSRPTEFRLEQNEPNPFREKTTIRFAAPRACSITLLVLNRDKELVHLLYNGRVKPGVHSIIWSGETDDGQRASEGIYQYQMLANGFFASRKMEIQHK